MTGWSAAILERGLKEGREQGLEQGRAEGRTEGLEQGLEQGLLHSIRRFVQTTAMTPEQVMDVLLIPQEERERYAELLAGQR